MAQCLTPFYVKDRNKDEIPVPCGKCPNCKARRVSAWSFRLMQEEKRAQSAHFVTLTYDTLYVPISKRGFMTLNKRDCQLFFKRLRKANKGRTIKYYLAGEYGGRTKRPHYHIILFNAELKTIQPAWNLGQIHYGAVSAASVGYCLKYISKGTTVPLHKNDDRHREFSLMSKGLGENYLTKAMIAWHLADMNNRMYCNLEEGKKIAMPRYYKNKVYNEDQRDLVGVATRQKMLERQANAIAGDPHYWERLDQAKEALFRKHKIKYDQHDKL